jgi:hypothetical protein
LSGLLAEIAGANALIKSPFPKIRQGLAMIGGKYSDDFTLGCKE